MRDVRWVWVTRVASGEWWILDIKCGREREEIGKSEGECVMVMIT